MIRLLLPPCYRGRSLRAARAHRSAERETTRGGLRRRLPTTTANQQGDNRVVSNSIPVEAIDQFQVLTSVPGAEYQGAGAMNFTIKSGGQSLPRHGRGLRPQHDLRHVGFYCYQR